MSPDISLTYRNDPKKEVVKMTGTYTMGAPWLQFAQGCGFKGEGRPKNLAEAWLTLMTGGRGRVSHPFAPWSMHGGPAPFMPPWAGGGRGWRGMKARRGDVRAAILAVLAEQSMNGYQIIQEIAERSGGAWKPSPGSIYPTLQQLEDEGLVSAATDNGRRAFTLTDEGRAYVAEHAEEVAAPWETLNETTDDGLKPLIGQVGAAVWQLMAVGNAEQQAQGREALVELRNRLYAILSTDDDTRGQS
jgi:DNA-binding PadR family transcriptional regulator